MAGESADAEMPRGRTKGRHAMVGTGRLERTLSLVALGLVLGGCVLVMRPFLSSVLWAIVLTFSLWPVYRRVLGWMGRRHSLAALAMTLIIGLVLVLPFVVIGITLADNVKELGQATRRWMEDGVPGPPAWVEGVPLVGAMVAEYWREISGDEARFVAEAQKWLEPASAWVVSGGVKLGRGVLELSMSLLIAFFLFRDGTALADRLTLGVARLAGDRGKRLLDVAGNTIRSVVHGILGTALVQALVAGLGFAIAGVPGVAVLTLLTFFIAIIPMGPPLIWLPAAGWLFHQGEVGWAIFMFVWGIGVSSVDNIVRPWLISHGSRLPFILILLGVLGGAMAFGFIGFFLGPTLLALGYRLVEEWAARRSVPGEDDAPAEAGGGSPVVATAPVPAPEASPEDDGTRSVAR